MCCIDELTSCVNEFLAAVKMSPHSLVSNRPRLSALLCLICTLVSLTVAQTTDSLVLQATTDSPVKQCPAPTGGGAQSTCVCQTDNGQIIDLRPLDLAQKNGKAKFTGLKDEKGYSYDYNPCTPFNEGTGNACQNVFMCQKLVSKGLIYTVASTEQIMQESGKYYAQYHGPGNRVTKVYLNCDQCNHDGTISSVDASETSGGTESDYVLQLHSCHACPGGCGGGCGVAAGIIGIVLIIVIIVSLVAYFIIGALLLKFHFHASGTDIIPNKSFWCQLPLLIKDGFVFTFSPCVKFIGEKTGRRNDYQKI